MTPASFADRADVSAHVGSTPLVDIVLALRALPSGMARAVSYAPGCDAYPLAVDPCNSPPATLPLPALTAAQIPKTA